MILASRRFGIVVVAVAATAPLAAQSPSALPFDPCSLRGTAPAPLAGPIQELARMEEIGSDGTDRFLLRPSDEWVAPLCARTGDGPAIRLGPVELALLPATMAAHLNTSYPDDRNNGAFWSGVGAGSMLSAGVAARLGPLSAGFIPEFVVQQNAEFREAGRPLPGFSPHVNPFETTIDLPQRFGSEPFSSIELGQSFARLDAFGFAFGISHENLWVGPAARNPLLMSNTAPGFTHLFLGTTRPVDLWLARVSAQLVLGRLEESDHFDALDSNDRSNLALTVIGVQPRWLDGLELGIARAYMYRPSDPGGFGAFSDLDIFVPAGESNFPGNELASLFARWVLPESRAELYGEWGRDDRWGGIFRDFVPEPDHSQAYMFGFQKVTGIGAERVLRVQAELTHLQEKQEPRTGRTLPIWYTHSAVRQGYTHRGQLLGAGIGPGADAQFVGVDLLDDWGMAGLYVERVRRNDASQAAVAGRYAAPYDHDTALTLGLRALKFVRGFSIAGNVSLSHRWDRDFIEDNNNVALSLEATWWPASPSD